jgi:hypothetical protein
VKLRNACGVRGVTMVPEADGDDSRHWSCRQVPVRYCVVCAAIPGGYSDARGLECRNRQRYLLRVVYY